jgi:hypothetical protein
MDSFQQIHNPDVATSWQAKQHLHGIATTTPDIICQWIVDLKCSTLSPRTLVDSTLLLDVAIETIGTALEPSIAVALIQQLCHVVLTVPHHQGCVLKSIRNLLKHCVTHTSPYIEYNHVLDFLHTAFTSDMVVHTAFQTYSQVQLLKTIHVMVDIAIKDVSLGTNCGGTLLTVLATHGLPAMKRWQQQQDTAKNDPSHAVDALHLEGFLTGDNTQRRLREATCIGLRAAVLLQRLMPNELVVEEVGEEEEEEREQPGEQPREQPRGQQGAWKRCLTLLQTLPDDGQRVQDTVRLMANSDDDLLVLLSSLIGVATLATRPTVGAGVNTGERSFPTWKEWRPTCVLGHLSALMGRSGAVECVLDTLMSPENGVQMLMCLLRLCKLNRLPRTVRAEREDKEEAWVESVSVSASASVSEQEGRAVLDDLKRTLIKCEASLPFGIGPLLRVM